MTTGTPGENRRCRRHHHRTPLCTKGVRAHRKRQDPGQTQARTHEQTQVDHCNRTPWATNETETHEKRPTCPKVAANLRSPKTTFFFRTTFASTLTGQPIFQDHGRRIQRCTNHFQDRLSPSPNMHFYFAYRSQDPSRLQVRRLRARHFTGDEALGSHNRVRVTQSAKEVVWCGAVCGAVCVCVCVCCVVLL